MSTTDSDALAMRCACATPRPRTMTLYCSTGQTALTTDSTYSTCCNRPAHHKVASSLECLRDGAPPLSPPAPMDLLKKPWMTDAILPAFEHLDKNRAANSDGEIVVTHPTRRPFAQLDFVCLSSRSGAHAFLLIRIPETGSGGRNLPGL